MKIGRFFVTAVATLTMLGAVACSKDERKQNDEKSVRRIQIKALVAEGDALIAQSDAIRKELDEKYKIKISEKSIQLAVGVVADPKTLGKEFIWSRLTLAEREKSKELLTSNQTLLTKVLEIEAKKGVYVKNVRVIKDRKTANESFLISLENFENLYGSLYNPPSAGTGPVYKNMP